MAHKSRKESEGERDRKKQSNPRAATSAVAAAASRLRGMCEVGERDRARIDAKLWCSCLQLLLLLPAVEQVKCEIFVSLRLNWIFHKSAAKRKDSFHLRFTIIQTDWKQSRTHTRTHTNPQQKNFRSVEMPQDIFIHLHATLISIFMCRRLILTVQLTYLTLY